MDRIKLKMIDALNNIIFLLTEQEGQNKMATLPVLVNTKQTVNLLDV
jgi:hypothetical protein